MAISPNIGAPAPTEDHDMGVPVADVMRAVASELADLGDAADSLQGLFGQLMRERPGALNREALEAAQALDSLVQRLGAVSTFLSELASTMATDMRVDTRSAADLLLLAAVAQRLSRPDVAVGVPAPHDEGHCDLF